MKHCARGAVIRVIVQPDESPDLRNLGNAVSSSASKVGGHQLLSTFALPGRALGAKRHALNLFYDPAGSPSRIRLPATRWAEYAVPWSGRSVTASTAKPRLCNSAQTVAWLRPAGPSR